jgi:hypothetical protein
MICVRAEIERFSRTKPGLHSLTAILVVSVDPMTVTTDTLTDTGNDLKKRR